MSLVAFFWWPFFFFFFFCPNLPHRFLDEVIHEYILPPTLLPNILLAMRTVLFPQNTIVQPVPQAPASVSARALNHTPVPGSSDIDGHNNNNHNHNAATTTTPGILPAHDSIAPPLPANYRPPPSKIVSIRRRCASSILSLVPLKIARIFFGIAPWQEQEHQTPTVNEATAPTPTPTRSHTTINTTTTTTSSTDSETGNRKSKAPENNQKKHEKEEEEAEEEEEEEEEDEEKEREKESSLLLEIIETDILDLLSDEYCNKHLIYALLETVLARIMPELRERSVCELNEDRGLRMEDVTAD